MLEIVEDLILVHMSLSGNVCGVKKVSVATSKPL